MEIKAHAKTYNVIFEEDFKFIEKLASVNQTLWVIDKKVYELYKELFEQNTTAENIMLVEATESNKVIETALTICERMTNLSAKRNSTIISVGGGIIQDITGFAANILYRGVKWIFVPTTLLAACDSCIGSKTSLNYKKYKNLLGTFYPPDELHICSLFFRTLSQIDFLSGLGEVVKFNVMGGEKDILALKKDMPQILQRKETVINEYVHKSLEFKKPFVEADEYDKGIRIHLNFAHTFGHAFETTTNYAIPHGTAVAMGTIVANEIAYSRGNIDRETQQSIEDLLLQVIDIKLLEKENQLVFDEVLNLETIMSAIRKDKKQIDANITAVLFKNQELALEIVHDVQENEINNALIKLRKILG